jgi:hypothetical protein
MRHLSDLRDQDNVSAFRYYVEGATEPTDRFLGRRWKNTGTTTVAGVPPFATGTWNGLAWTSIQRHVVNTTETFYVNATTGSNSNDGRTASSAFATIQYALDIITWFDTGDRFSRISLIQVANGTYNEALTYREPLGNGVVRIYGDSLNPQNVIINGGAGIAVTNDGGRRLQIGGLTLQGNQGLVSSNNGRVALSGGGPMRFGACTVNQILVTTGGIVDCFVGLTFAGNAQSAIFAESGGLFNTSISAMSVTFDGAPTYTAGIMRARSGGSVILANQTSAATFTGAPVGTRYVVSEAGLIVTRTGNLTLIPGTVAGTTASGGEYT